MRKIYVITILTLLVTLPVAFQVAAQAKDHIVSVEIKWEAVKNLYPGHTIFYFDGAVNHDSLGFLPVFQYNIPHEFTGKVAGYSILNEVYEPLAPVDFSTYPDIDLIQSEPVVLIPSHITRKKPEQIMFLMPLRKSGDGEGFERLKSCDVALNISSTAILDEGRSNTGSQFTENSVLSSGDWYRIAVKETGIYIITYNDLIAMGIDPDQINPQRLRLYGNGSGMLNEANSMTRTDDLRENAIYIEGEADGRFDGEDFILFYGEGPVTIEYNDFYNQFVHELNFYTDHTYYFLTPGQENGKRIGQAEEISGEVTHEIYNFQDLAYHEKEEINLLKSGKIWYGEVFNQQLDYIFPFGLTDRKLDEPMSLKVDLAGRSTTKTLFRVTVNGSLISELDVPSVVVGSQVYARPITSNYEEFSANENKVDIGISFEKPGSIDIGWLNYIVVNYVRHLRFNGGCMNFRDARSVGPGNIARYHLQAGGQAYAIWEITDPSDIVSQPFLNEAGGLYFDASAEILREYIIFDNLQLFEPVFIEKVENQNLHSLQPAEYIIVAHPMFLDQAQRLADHHRQYDGMNVHIVTPQHIYNEFSSGAQDVSAIRDFMRMLYERAEPGQEPRYLLLFGDAAYDFKDYTPEDNNLVPAYQSRESLKSASSFVTDDFFGCLDPEEGSNGSGTMDVGVGRFPVHTIEQAEAMVNKSLNYMVPARENYGPWRNSVCFIADDEDNNIHLGQAEGLVEIADSLGPDYNVNKIYLDAYAQMKTPGGDRYPDVNVAIDKAVNDGCLIVNYTGHGGEVAWAGERVLDIPAIQSYRNSTQLPAFLTATCEFSRYDDPGLISAGELVFLNPDGAGIGLFTTTRLAYSQSNYSMNKRFYYEAFTIDSLTGDYPRMGDLIRVSKTPSNQNIKNFVLLGDPALMLSYPKMRVRTVNVINDRSGKQADTINALSRVTIEGRVEDLQGNPLSDFNGLVYPSVYDKPVKYRTRANDPSSKVTDFYIQDKKIFEGVASVTDGEFSFTFIVPVDISYQFGKGKISYYALDTSRLIDAQGHDEIWIGGSDILAMTDAQGPEIGLYLNVMTFVSGDYTVPEPMLIVTLTDSSGINTVGNGIGHDIVGIIDGNYQEPLILNDYFIPLTDSFQEGRILYQLGPFANGNHTLTLKAWDVLNNSSEKTIGFIVNTDARLSISQVGNYPNPFSDGTYFVFEQNKPGSELDVTIMIYSLSGQHVTSLRYNVLSESTGSGPLYWNGLDASGNELPAGLYVYRLMVQSDDGYYTSVSRKFMIHK